MVKSTKKRGRETEPTKVQKRRKTTVAQKYVVDESDEGLNLKDSPGMTLEEAHPEDIEPVDDDSRDSVEGCTPRRGPPKTPIFAKGKDRHAPATTDTQKEACHEICYPATAT